MSDDAEARLKAWASGNPQPKPKKTSKRKEQLRRFEDAQAKGKKRARPRSNPRHREEEERDRENFARFVATSEQRRHDQPAGWAAQGRDQPIWTANGHPVSWPAELPGVPNEGLSDCHGLAALLKKQFDAYAGGEAFHVGIDAGTSGIRIGAFAETTGATTLHDFGQNVAGGTRFSFPAVAAVSDGKLLLGNDAARMPPGGRFASFKAALVHEEVDQQICADWERRQLPYGSTLCNARPSVSDFLYSASIARALELALPPLVFSAGVPGYLDFAVGIPATEFPGMRERFTRGLLAALLLTGSLGPEPPLDLALRRYATAWKGAASLLEIPREQQRFFLVEEPVAAVASLRRLFNLGTSFLVADIGATTTDVALLRVGSDGLACFAARSIPVGGDYADRLVLGERADGADLLEIRLHRQDLLAKTPDDAEREFGAPLRKTAQTLRSALQSTLATAFRANPDTGGSWSVVQLVLAGGGSRIPHLAQALESAPAPHSAVEEMYRQTVAVSWSELKVEGASGRAPAADEGLELLTVIGAATPNWDLPEMTPPDQIERTIPTYESPLLELERARLIRWI